ncbi:MAG: hypothetical protein ACUVQ1_08540 [Candidatus Kapaibacteriales bacterium]
MEAVNFQLLGIVFASLISFYGVFRNIRNEMRQHQKQILESRLSEERRIMAIENRLGLAEQRNDHFANLVNFQLNQRSIRVFFCSFFRICQRT